MPYVSIEITNTINRINTMLIDVQCTRDMLLRTIIPQFTTDGITSNYVDAIQHCTDTNCYNSVNNIIRHIEYTKNNIMKLCEEYHIELTATDKQILGIL